MIRRILRFSAVALLIAAAAIQFIPGPPRINPASDPAKDYRAHVRVPDEVASVLDRACADCHSNRTRWPFYSYVAPVRWFVAGHVNHGRKHLNLSDWTQEKRHSDGPPIAQIRNLCEVVNNGSMPMKSYLLLHRDARLSDADRRVLCDWSNAQPPLTSSRR